MKPQGYAIRIAGHLSESWAEWFEGQTIRHEENGDTTLLGTVADQSALLGLLIRIHDLGLKLISVTPLP